MNQRIELLPCPFCAGEPRELRRPSSMTKWQYCITCNKCGAEGECESNPVDAANKWNTRRPQEPKATLGRVASDAVWGVIKNRGLLKGIGYDLWDEIKSDIESALESSTVPPQATQGETCRLFDDNAGAKVHPRLQQLFAEDAPQATQAGGREELLKAMEAWEKALMSAQHPTMLMTFDQTISLKEALDTNAKILSVVLGIQHFMPMVAAHAPSAQARLAQPLKGDEYACIDNIRACLSDSRAEDGREQAVEYLRSFVAAAQPTWQPISTAPKDTPVIIITFFGQVFKAHRTITDADTGYQWGTIEDDDICPKSWTEGACWSLNEDEEPSDWPVGWMPLPAAPQTDKAGE